MFLENDVLVLQEQVKDRLRLREEDRLAAAVGRQARSQHPQPYRQRAVIVVGLLVQRLLPG